MANWLQCIVAAYRPAYLRGLLLDGQHRLPRAELPAGLAKLASRARQRSVLATLTHIFLHPRSKA